MAYSFQVFVFKAVLTSAQMNQVEINIRDHVHGSAGVSAPAANVALKNIDNIFTVSQSISLASARINVDAAGGTPGFVLKRSGVTTVLIGSSAADILNFHDSAGAIRGTWDLSTNPATLTLGSVPDARLTANVALKNINNDFSVAQSVGVGVPLTGDVFTIGTSNIATTEGGLLIQSLAAGSGYVRLNRLSGFESKLFIGNNTNAGSDSPTTAITIDGLNGNNVGIGLETATAKLHVAGTGLFTGDMAIAKASASLSIDATTGNPLLRMQRAAANSVAIDSTATNILNFKNNADAARVSWDLSGTVGKLTQGDVPWARLKNSTTSASNTAASGLNLALPQDLVVDDIVLVFVRGAFTKDAAAGTVQLIASKSSGLGQINFVETNTNFQINPYLAANDPGNIYDMFAIGRAVTAGTYTFSVSIEAVVVTASNALSITVQVLKGT